MAWLLVLSFRYRIPVLINNIAKASINNAATIKKIPRIISFEPNAATATTTKAMDANVKNPPPIITVAARNIRIRALILCLTNYRAAPSAAFLGWRDKIIAVDESPALLLNQAIILLCHISFCDVAEMPRCCCKFTGGVARATQTVEPMGGTPMLLDPHGLEARATLVTSILLFW